MTTFSRLEDVTEAELRTIWPDEARDFTKWLAQEANISLLEDAVGLKITPERTESAVGSFRADILAKITGTDRKIIIENQLECTDHEHLGKLITYAAGKGAEVAIWVAKSACDEHRAAIRWLNNQTDAKICFFLCEIRLYRIENSAPAVKFEVLEQPNARRRKILAEQGHLEYWTTFLAYASPNKTFANAFNTGQKPSASNYFGFSIGHACSIGAIRVVNDTPNLLKVEFKVDNDKNLFNSLLEHRNAIESAANLVFEWRDREASSVIVVEKQVSFDDQSAWKEQFDWIIDIMLKMKEIFGRYL